MDANTIISSLTESSLKPVVALEYVLVKQENSSFGLEHKDRLRKFYCDHYQNGFYYSIDLPIGHHILLKMAHMFPCYALFYIFG